MSGVKLWSKTLGKNYWKRVSDYWQHARDEENLSYTGAYSSVLKNRNENKQINVALLPANCSSGSYLQYLGNRMAAFSDQGNVTGVTKEYCKNETSMMSLSSMPNNSSTVFSLNQSEGMLSKFSNMHPVRSYSSCKTVGSKNTPTPFKTTETKCYASTESISSKQSVLESMGIDRNSDTKASEDSSDNKSGDGNDDQKNDGSDKEKAESAFLRSQRIAKWVLLGSITIGSPFFILSYGSPPVNELGEEVKDQYSDSPTVVAYIRRAWGEVNLVKRDIVEPSAKKLLPDPLQEPYYQPPYTLVIELMDVFLRPVYDSVSGWRFKKRPGIDYFLAQVGPPLYEVVIFTRETGMTAYPLIESMDQKGYIMYRLFRDAARYKSGFSIGNPLDREMPKLDPYYQKDLKYLNRDLKKVIIIDCEKRAFELQPENGLCLEKWDGSTNDTTLYDLAGLLRAIASSNVDDVRPVLKHYSKHDKPIETFKLAQARMQEDSQLALRGSTNSQLFSGASNTVSSFLRRR